jgi:MFS family permease
MTAIGRPPRADDWAVVIAAGLCGAVGAFDLGGVNVVLPELAKDFGVQPATVQWVVLAYLLPIAALAIPVGRWLDTVGRRSAMILLVSGFTVASVLVGLSPNLAWVIVSRALQGCFGAGLFALTVVLAYQAVRPENRVRAIAIVSTIGPLGGIAGPSGGAFIADALGWPWVFWIMVPILLTAIVVFAVRLPRDRGLHWPSGHFATEALLLGGATAAVLLALTWAPEYHPAWSALALIAIPCVLIWRRSHAGSPVLRLLAVPGFGWAILALAALAAAGMSAQYLLAFFAQQNLGFSVSQAGLALLFFAIGTIPSSLAAGWLSTRFRPVIVSTIGFAVLALGILSAAVLLAAIPGAVWPFATLAGICLALGIGQGLANTPATTISLGCAPPELTATAGSAMSFLRNIGFTAGPATMTAIWAAGGYGVDGMRVALIVAAVLAIGGAIAVRLSVAGRRVG